MLIKAGVDISRLKREIRRSLTTVQIIYNIYEEEIVITSTYEGSHGEGSLHYDDNAYDLRKPRDYAKEIEMKLRGALGPSFDVVLEGDHIHIEYDPKT